MNSRLDEIARRKNTLIARCDGERDGVAAALRHARSCLALRGIASRVSHNLKAHPIVAGGVTSLLASGYTTPFLKTAAEGLRLWRVARPLWLLWKKKTS